jgi:membrane protease YdiL (CAAX protease family)
LEPTYEPPPPDPLALLVPALRAGLYLVAYVVIQFAVALLVVYPALHTGAPSRLGGFGGFGGSVELALLAVLATIPPQILVTWLFVRCLDRRTLASLGARWPTEGAGGAGGKTAALRQLATSTLGALAVLGAWLGLVLLLPDTLAAVRFGGISPEFLRGPAWWPFPPLLLLALLLLAFLLQGGLEEWVMRGYVYRTLRERWPAWASALASALLFALLHLQNPGFSWLALANIALAGMVLAGLAERTGSLWSSTVAHGVWNFAVACLLSLPVSGVSLFHLLRVATAGNEEVTGGGFGPEGSAVLTLFGFLLTAFLWRGMWRRRPEKTADSGPPSAAEDVPRAVSS